MLEIAIEGFVKNKKSTKFKQPEKKKLAGRSNIWKILSVYFTGTGRMC